MTNDDSAAQRDERYTKPDKPLGAKAYGSIGHLKCSRIGHGDHFVHIGQQNICTVRPRKGDRIIVTEKLDGACMSVANISGELVALSRAGYRARDTSYEHLRLFDVYVADNYRKFYDILSPGERIVGEWLGMAHGTLYDPTHRMFSPFIAFDIFRDGKRILADEFDERVKRSGIISAARIHDGQLPCSVASALQSLGQYGNHGAMETVEGAVWRVERDGRVDFLAKFVRHDKIDGKYLPNINNTDPVWYWRPSGEFRPIRTLGVQNP